MFDMIFNTYLVGGWATPLKNMKVNWDDYSQYIWENKIDVPNHQPDTVYESTSRHNFYQPAGPCMAHTSSIAWMLSRWNAKCSVRALVISLCPREATHMLKIDENWTSTSKHLKAGFKHLHFSNISLITHISACVLTLAHHSFQNGHAHHSERSTFSHRFASFTAPCNSTSVPYSIQTEVVAIPSLKFVV